MVADGTESLDLHDGLTVTTPVAVHGSLLVSSSPYDVAPEWFAADGYTRDEILYQITAADAPAADDGSDEDESDGEGSDEDGSEGNDLGGENSDGGNSNQAIRKPMTRRTGPGTQTKKNQQGDDG
jgi:hypothetical protein